MSKGSRNYVFTNWNIDLDLYDAWSPVYMYYGLEVCPDTGRSHQQGWLRFKDAKTHSAVTKMVARLVAADPFLKHFFMAPMLGSVDENIRYCQKGENVVEKGVRPMSNDDKGRAEHNRWQRNLELAKAGDILAIDADIQFRHYNVIKQIMVDYAPPPVDLVEPCGYWIYGPTHSGKTWFTKTEYPGHYRKKHEDSWNGYRNEEVVCIQDLGHFHWKDAVACIMDWADCYAFPINIKYSSGNIRPLKIVVTSNYSIDEWLDHVGAAPAAREPFKRRFKGRITHMEKPFE